MLNGTNGTYSTNGVAEPDSDAIAKRAYELYLQRGSVPGFELDDWLQAEAELFAVASVKKAAAPSKTPRNSRSR
jgi:hypothetical protein